MEKELKQDLTDKMDKALSILNRDLNGLRTGRASVNLLDPVIVEAYGSKMPISQVGTVSTPDAKTIAVQVWDKEMVKSVEKAITDANLGLNPNSDGQLIRMNLPHLNEERRKELVKVAQQYGEKSKIAIRNIRRDGMDKLKSLENSHDISEDEYHKLSDEVQKITDDFNLKIDNYVQVKEKEIITI